MTTTDVVRGRDRHGGGLPRSLRVRQRFGGRDRLVRRGLRRRRDGPLRRRRRPHRTRRGVDRQRPADALRRVPGDRCRRPADVGRHPVYPEPERRRRRRRLGAGDRARGQRRASPHRSAVRRAVVHVPRPVRTSLVGADDDQPSDTRRGRRGDGGLHRGDERTRGSRARSPSSTAPVELGYFTLGFTDTALASRFYRELFGWQTEQGRSGAEYAHVNNTQLPLGFTPDGVDSPPALYFRVDDARAYAARVRELGGTIVSETTYDSGGNVVCRDDQGREFQLWQPAPGY